MSKFGGLLARAPAANKPVSSKSGSAAETDTPLDIDEELFASLGAQIGGENEALRNLLINASTKLSELDVIKDAVGKLVDPVNKALRDFETERSEKAGLQTILANTRAAYAKVKSEASEIERKAAGLERECAELRQELIAAQHQTRLLETAKAELVTEIGASQARIAELGAELQQETAQAKTAREEAHRLDQRLTGADKRIVALETDLNNTRQRLVLSEDERHNLQTSLDKSVAEAARLSRRLAEAENTVNALQGRLRHTEGSLAEANTERSRLATMLDELKERHAAELTTQQLRFDAMQSRAASADKLLGEARDQLAQRSEEIRQYDRRYGELTQAYEQISARLTETEAERQQRDADVEDLERTRTTLIERSSALAKAFTAKETALARAEETVRALNERVAYLETQAQARSTDIEQQLEEMAAALRREKLERSVVEGALETARKDFARLMREVLSLQRQRGAEEPAPALRSANAA
jgi:crescentin